MMFLSIHTVKADFVFMTILKIDWLSKRRTTMLNKTSSLSKTSNNKVDACLSPAFENKALQNAFKRIEDNDHFSTGIPGITNYDDYDYPDCSYDDNGNN